MASITTPSPAGRILVLGATGASGLAFIPEALSHATQPDLTLYVRSRSKLPAEYLSHSRIRIVEGSLTDADALSSAMENVRTVISMLGAYVSLSAFLFRTHTTPIGDAFPTILDAMRRSSSSGGGGGGGGTKFKRIFALSTSSAWPLPEEKAGLPWSRWLVDMLPPLLVPQGYAEMRAIAQHVAALGTDDELIEWTIFRVPHLTNASADLKVAAGILAPDYKGSMDLSRASQARWLLNEIVEREWLGKAPILGNY